MGSGSPAAPRASSTGSPLGRAFAAHGDRDGLPHARRAPSSRAGAARLRRQAGDRADRRRDGAGRARRRSADLRVEPPGRRGAARRGRASAAPGSIAGAALAGARARGLRGGPSPVERGGRRGVGPRRGARTPSPRARTTRVGESAFGDVSLSGYDGRAALTHRGDAAITGDRGGFDEEVAVDDDGIRGGRRDGLGGDRARADAEARRRPERDAAGRAAAGPVDPRDLDDRHGVAGLAVLQQPRLLRPA